MLGSQKQWRCVNKDFLASNEPCISVDLINPDTALSTQLLVAKPGSSAPHSHVPSVWTSRCAVQHFHWICHIIVQNLILAQGVQGETKLWSFKHILQNYIMQNYIFWVPAHLWTEALKYIRVSASVYLELFFCLQQKDMYNFLLQTLKWE